MKTANLKKVLVAGVAAVMLMGVAHVASAQYPSYTGYVYGTYYPSSGYLTYYPGSVYPGIVDPGFSPGSYGGYVNPQRFYDPNTNLVQPGSLQHIHRHLADGRIIDGYTHIDAYGISRFTGNSFDRFGNSTPIVTSAR